MNYLENVVLIHFDKMNAQGAFGINPADKRNVYIHNQSGVEVKQGDWWYCRLELNPNFMACNYFAMPMMKVDSEFLANLSEDSWKKIAEYACSNHKEIVTEKVKTLVPEMIPGSDATHEPVQVQEVKRKADVFQEKPSLDEKVWYLGNNTLGSSYFKEKNYFVCRSYNGKNLQIYPDRKGNIECRDHELCVAGLDELIGSDGQVEMQFNAVKGMVMISI